MRKRIHCEHRINFGRVKNPCRITLAEIEGDKIIEKGEGEVEVTNLERITLKCSRKGCGNKTIIKNK